MANYFTSRDTDFTLWENSSKPAWRPPQIGALGALVGHWTTSPQTPALITMPTGSGKSAVAVASAFLAGAQRVLVIVPSAELRRQLAETFRDPAVLRTIGALVNTSTANVVEVTGRLGEWGDLENADVVVALPNSISPVHYTDRPPPRDLFDLVLIDEAHHSPAATWRAVVEHFEAKFLLLTATPHRADGKRVLGEHIFHYPMRQALREGIFKSVQADVVALPDDVLESKELTDSLILARAVSYFNEETHGTSTLMGRAATRHRAKKLADQYTQAGVPTVVLHSGLSAANQRAVVDNLRAGTVRAVAVVGMLIEGFDLPSLRLVAYHDKHKSLPVTAQLVGRLARVDSNYPQPSILITVNDTDVYPELKGTLKALYAEDSDWAQVLPGIIDDEIAEANANRDFVLASFPPGPQELAIDSVSPLCRSILWEIPVGSLLPPAFGLVEVPEKFREGQTLRGKTIMYSALHKLERSATLLVITSGSNSPRWHAAPGLETREYQLHMVTALEPTLTTQPALLLVNTKDNTVAKILLEELDPDFLRRAADPEGLQCAFDSLERTSVSSVGVRNSYAGATGTPSYKMFSGKGVDRGLRQIDTAQASLGHAMVQVVTDGTTYTAGLATGKSKYWESRYLPLRRYFSFLSDLAGRYWTGPRPSVSGQLLPYIDRGVRLQEWPSAEPLAVVLDVSLLGSGLLLGSGVSLDSTELRAFQAKAAPSGEIDRLPIEVYTDADGVQTSLWSGEIDTLGNVHTNGPDPVLRKGFSQVGTISELLVDNPPTVFFSNGATVHGTTLVDSRTTYGELTLKRVDAIDWSGVDCGAETDLRAMERGIGQSVHARLEAFLLSRPSIASHRWLICNDGSGEIADYLLIEADLTFEGPTLATADVRSVSIELWHAKAAGGSPALRVTDLQEVLAQAIKSRRWITDAGIWQEVGRRVHGESSPAAVVKHGDVSALDAICGKTSDPLAFTRSRPIVRGSIGIVQPGVSREVLYSDLWMTKDSARQCRELLNVYNDSVAQVAVPALICSA